MTTLFRLSASAALALPLLAIPAAAKELSGAILSATGTLPARLEVVADRADKLPLIVGKVEGGRYRITLPESGLFRLRVQAPEWEAAPKIVADPQTAGALDFYVYPAKVPEPELARELIELGEQDQALRQEAPPPEQGKPAPEFIARWEREDAKRCARLEQIIAAKGWPTISMVGYEAQDYAWLLAQHAPKDRLKRWLPLMQAAYDRHELLPKQLALSIDRVLVDDGKPQRYGSQFQTNEDGHTFMLPLEDPEHVNARRRAMGLDSIERYSAAMLGK